MNIKEIKEMISLMNENGLMELEIERDGMRIKLKRMPSASGTEAMSGPVVVEKEGLPAGQFKDSIGAAERAGVKTVEIKAPMVGTFYRSPSPEAPPYVEVGQIVEPGQGICIIEAMKLMNEIKSEIKGKIIEIVADNAEPVEFGQPMFLIEPL
ncbi:MAG: acetyl-CoA carboxylase biotin carboxyl carrier protein [Candidatus Omnitrophica bacterium]|nr:acetyl-CoA carboxylase biotin carboxyl carrier protein [Candidatus Omnitrophota bacterium]MBU4473430.1 acetyl-CoA carboxylase biotin carboxyl carrier protein [Candidatus Omnitrophota bacterium]MCG2706235.1 acetyl-CoA carboxylase biotin carboxyl carrier protein [Candidatus Omnitrophota bacterium]